MTCTHVMLLCTSICMIAPYAADAAQRRRNPMQMTSSAFTEGQPIPLKYSGYGQDISPALQWTNVPEGTKSLALIVTDPDAPIANPPWVHWVVYHIPATATGLPEGVNVNTIDARAGMTNFGTTKYGGPRPPQGNGVHHYEFTLYALDTELDHLPAGMRYQDVLNAMINHVLVETTLIGTYEKK